MLYGQRDKGIYNSLQKAVEICIQKCWPQYLVEIWEGTLVDGCYVFQDVDPARCCVQGYLEDHIRETGDPLDWLWKPLEDIK
jgi:hypothetical protein